jgi:diguanylate cyclase (GGDEF)-like protein
MIKITKSIGLRLLRYVFGCYLIIAILVTGIQLMSEYNHVKDNIFTQLHELEKSFKDSFVNSMWSFDIPQLKVTLLGVTKIEIVSGIKIVTDSNKLLASSGDVVTETSQILSSANLKSPGMRKLELKQTGSPNTETLFEYKFPLEYLENNTRSDLIGYGYIYTNVDTIIERVKYSFILIIINSLIKTAALWLFFLYFVNRFIAKPLKALANAAGALNPDKLDTLNYSEELESVVKSKHKDELYLLSTNFNQMRIAIIDKINVIQSQRNTLEQRVLKRTESLSEANDELRHLALHDSLTSLPNRTLLQDRLEQFLKAGQRNNNRFVIASIDLTDFKNINDTYGHQVGDIVLVEVARRLTSVLRRTDTIARMGGDEFYALFALGPDDMSNGELIVQKFIKALETPILYDADDTEGLLVTANIGTAIYPSHGEDSESLIKNADMAMYLAKNSGISFALYSADEDLRLRRISQLGQDFKSAITNNQLFLVYQPILDIKAKSINKIEALVRWLHPTLGPISPVEFIPICERSSSIHALTQWVFNEACQQCRPYIESNQSLSISINLSGRVFSQAEISKSLVNICKLWSIPPENINLEVTESTTMDKPDQAISILSELNSKGFTVSIDDFGTGYSSFSYLTMLPVQELKIDKSFLLNMGKNSHKVIKAMIDLAHSLSLRVVGEGVETESLLKLLNDMGCDYAQGYHISKPLPIEELDKLLTQPTFQPESIT